jgi:hypothetical protein
MRETGDEFDAVVANAPGMRFRVRPVLRYGRAIPGKRPEVRSWSVWSYWLVEHPEIEAIPVVATSNTERPALLTCRFGTGIAAKEVHVSAIEPMPVARQRAA